MNKPDAVAVAADAPPEPTPHPEQDWFEEAIGQKLTELVDAPVTPKMLSQVGEFADRSRDLLTVLRSPGAFGKKRRHNYASDLQGLVGGDIDAEFDDGLGMMTPMTPRAETFGATVVREVIASFKDIAESMKPRPYQHGPIELVHAIALAREQHMDSLADSLQAELLKSQAVEPAPKDNKLLSKSGACPPHDVVDALLPGDPSAPAALHAICNYVAGDASLVESTTGPAAAVVAPFRPGGAKPATPAEAMALFDAMSEKRRRGELVTREEGAVAVRGALAALADPSVTPRKLTRGTPYDPNRGSGFGGPPYAAMGSQPVPHAGPTPPAAPGAGSATFEPCYCPRGVGLRRHTAGIDPELSGVSAAARAAEEEEFVEHDTGVLRAAGLLEPTAPPYPNHGETLDAALAPYHHALLVVESAIINVPTASRGAVEERIDLMRKAIEGLPSGWNTPDSMVGGVYRHPLLDIRSTLGSLAFAPPEGVRYNLVEGLARIRDALDGLPKGWSSTPYAHPGIALQTTTHQGSRT